MTSSPIPATYRSTGPAWIAKARAILAAHRPDDYESLQRATGERAALGRVTGGAR